MNDDSMNPKISYRDIVFCDPSITITSGDIVYYLLNGEVGIKIYKINESGTVISLIPINCNYDIIAIHCDEKHNLKMAKVVGKIDKDF
jgi:phage repressor protein C with HTH and peptisase S24 domain